MLARLLNPPRSADEWQLFGFDHLDSHDRIRAAIAAQGGPALNSYQVYPIPLEQIRVFLTANQQLHIDMDSALGLQASDLQDVDLTDEHQLAAWINLHWLEHQTAERTLGIGG